MKKLIFYSNNFFGSGLFLIHKILKSDQKMAAAKKVVTIKSQFFHTHQLRKGIL